jgi:hypothetical protein
MSLCLRPMRAAPACSAANIRSAKIGWVCRVRRSNPTTRRAKSAATMGEKTLTPRKTHTQTCEVTWSSSDLSFEAVRIVPTDVRLERTVKKSREAYHPTPALSSDCNHLAAGGAHETRWAPHPYEARVGNQEPPFHSNRRRILAQQGWESQQRDLPEGAWAFRPMNKRSTTRGFSPGAARQTNATAQPAKSLVTGHGFSRAENSDNQEKGLQPLKTHPRETKA